MRKSVGLGIVILLVVLIISPVAACHVEVSKAGENEVCTTCDFYTYTINVKSVAGGSGDTNYLVRVEDTLPDGIVFVSYTDNAPVSGTATCANPSSPVLDSGCRVIRWDYSNVPHNAEWIITLNVKPVGASDGGSVTNVVEGSVKHYSWSGFEGEDSSSATTFFENDLCPIPSPEFPTMAVPAALIVGILGAVLFVQRTKEN